MKETFGCILQTDLRPMTAKGLVVLRKRGVVERTFPWIGSSRRNERSTETSETMIYVTVIGFVSRKFARKTHFEETLLVATTPIALLKSGAG